MARIIRATWIPSPKMICVKIGWYCSGGSAEDFRISSICFRYCLIIWPLCALCQIWLKLAQWFLRRRSLDCVNVFSLLRSYLPLGKGVAVYLNKIESTPPKDTLCLAWLELVQYFSRKRFLNFVCENEAPRPFLKNLNSRHPRMLCATFGWNWRSGSWEEDL